MSRELALTEELSQILTKDEAPNDGLQLRRAISAQAEVMRLLENHATARSAARLCWAARGPTYSAIFRSQAVRGFSPLFVALDL